jgi:hypothetical protein
MISPNVLVTEKDSPSAVKEAMKAEIHMIVKHTEAVERK